MARARRWADGSAALLDQQKQGTAVVVRDAEGNHTAVFVPTDPDTLPTGARVRAAMTDGSARDVAMTLLAETLVDSSQTTVEDLGDGRIRRITLVNGGADAPDGQTITSIEQTVNGETKYTRTIELNGGQYIVDHGTQNADGFGKSTGILYGPDGRRLADVDMRRYRDGDSIHQGETYLYTDGSSSTHVTDAFDNGVTSTQDVAKDSSGKYTKNDTTTEWTDHSIESHLDPDTGETTIKTHAEEELPGGQKRFIDGTMTRDANGQPTGDVTLTDQIDDYARQATTTKTMVTHSDNSRDVNTRHEERGVTLEDSTEHLPPTSSLDWSEIGNELITAMTTGDPIDIPGITDVDETGSPQRTNTPGRKPNSTTETTTEGRTTRITTTVDQATSRTTGRTESTNGRTTRTVTTTDEQGTRTTITVDGEGSRTIGTRGRRIAGSGAEGHPRIGRGRGSGITLSGTACDPGMDASCIPIYATARQPGKGVVAARMTTIADLIDPAQPAGGLDAPGTGRLASAARQLAQDLFDMAGERPVLDVDTGPIPGAYSDALRATLVSAPNEAVEETGWHITAGDLFVRLSPDAPVRTTFTVIAPLETQVGVAAEFDLSEPFPQKFDMSARVVAPTLMMYDESEFVDVEISPFVGVARPMRACLIDPGTGQQQAVSDWVVLLLPDPVAVDVTAMGDTL